MALQAPEKGKNRKSANSEEFPGIRFDDKQQLPDYFLLFALMQKSCGCVSL